MDLAKAIALKENLDDLRPLSKEPKAAIIQRFRSNGTITPTT